MNNQNREDYVDYNDQEYETQGFEDQGAFGEGAYQDPGYDDPGLADDAGYEDEDFPEPGAAAGEKKKMSPAMMAGAAALALTLTLGAGYYFLGGGEEGGESAFALPDVMAMITGESSESGEVAADAPPEGEEVPVEGEGEAAPPPPKPAAAKPKAAAKPADDGWSEPVEKKAPPKPAAKPVAAKPAAAKPAPAKPKPAAKPVVAAKPAAPKPKPLAAKPKPVAAATGGAKPSAQTSVSFASGSYWVASADMEKLWAFSTGLKTNAGRITIEAHPGGDAANGPELTQKRADRVAELIRRNNVGNRFDVNVKVGKAAGGTGRVDVYYSRAL